MLSSPNNILYFPKTGKQLKDYSKWSTQDIESNLNKSGIELDFEIDMEYDCGSDINCKDIKGMPRIKVGDSKYFFGLERVHMNSMCDRKTTNFNY